MSREMAMNSKKMAQQLGEGWSSLPGDRPGVFKGQIQVVLRDATDRPYLASFTDKEGVVLWVAYGITPKHAIEAARYKAETDIRIRQETVAAILEDLESCPEGERPSPDAALLR